jgi:hypothetical protein
MAGLITYAEVVTSEHPAAKAYEQGVAPRPAGRPLREYLELSGGRHEFRMPFGSALRAQIRQVAALTGDKALLAIAKQTENVISLEHLRGLDPETRIICGQRLEYTDEESRRLAVLETGPQRGTRIRE